MRGIVGQGAGWDQGDIVEAAYFGATDSSLPAVLLTPACDLEHDKVEFWTLVALFPDIEVARAICDAELHAWGRTAESLSGSQRKRLAEKIRDLIHQRFPRYQWLPLDHAGSAGYVADFTLVQSLPADEVRTLGRIGAVESRWREQMAARYAAYLGRIGTDDFTQADVESHVQRLLSGATG